MIGNIIGMLIFIVVGLYISQTIFEFMEEEMNNSSSLNNSSAPFFSQNFETIFLFVPFIINLIIFLIVIKIMVMIFKMMKQTGIFLENSKGSSMERFKRERRLKKRERRLKRELDEWDKSITSEKKKDDDTKKEGGISWGEGIEWGEGMK